VIYRKLAVSLLTHGARRSPASFRPIFSITCRVPIRPSVIAGLLLAQGWTYHVASIGDGRVIGFASGGPTRQGDFPHENEVYAIYILEEYQRQKIGGTLFRRFVDDLAESGRRGLILFALANNPNRAFYESLGGMQAMASPLTLGSATVDQFAYLWDDIAALPRNS
jgi:ribosomal protein S18 acetylase RimI-like enzyme